MRVNKIDPESMSGRQKDVFDRIAGSRGKLGAPFQVWINSPELCDRVERLGAYLRWDSTLPLRLRELSLLIAARAFDAQYSWNAHVDVAIAEGIPEAAVAAIAARETPAFDRAEDQVFFEFATTLLAEHFVPQDLFDQMVAHFGVPGVVDAVASLGNFTMLGMLLNTFEVDLQPDRTPPYPDVRGYERLALPA